MPALSGLFHFREPIMDDTKQCSCCKQRKPRSEFYKDLARRDGLTLTCKACNNAARNGRRRQAASDRATATALAIHRAYMARPETQARAAQADALAECLKAARGVE
jgi:hypothetical protein